MGRTKTKFFLVVLVKLPVSVGVLPVSVGVLLNMRQAHQLFIEEKSAA